MPDLLRPYVIRCSSRLESHFVFTLLLQQAIGAFQAFKPQARNRKQTSVYRKRVAHLIQVVQINSTIRISNGHVRSGRMEATCVQTGSTIKLCSGARNLKQIQSRYYDEEMWENNETQPTLTFNHQPNGREQIRNPVKTAINQALRAVPVFWLQICSTHPEVAR